MSINEYNGTRWDTTAAVKKYDGYIWSETNVFKYNGSAWVQIYPSTAMVGSFNKTATLSYVPNTGNSWVQGEGRGGFDSGAYYTGWTGITSQNFTGAGSVLSVFNAKADYTRKGIGNYSTALPLHMAKTSRKNGSGNGKQHHNSKDPKIAFESSLMSPVSSANATVSGTVEWEDNKKEFIDWLNSKAAIVIGSPNNNNYIGLTALTMSATYTYDVKLVIVEPATDTIEEKNSKESEVPKLEKIYLTKEEYDAIGFENISKESIEAYRAINGVPDLDETKVISANSDPFIYDVYDLHDDSQSPCIELIAFNILESDTIEVLVDKDWLKATKVRGNIYQVKLQQEAVVKLTQLKERAYETRISRKVIKEMFSQTFSPNNN